MSHHDETMDVETECGVCGCKIVDYYDEAYNGKRARCPKCNNNFPLE